MTPATLDLLRRRATDHRPTTHVIGEAVHHGNPDLDLFTPSTPELHFASRVVHGELRAGVNLRQLAGSRARYEALVAHVDRLRTLQAAQVCDRAFGDVVGGPA